MFFNEFHLLDLKISEELEHIDKLVLIESNKTHSNKPKQLVLVEKYKDPKIKILTCGEGFNSDARKNEAKQRDIVTKKIKFREDDIIICC